MPETGAALQVQQLVELLAVMTSMADERSVVHAAVERAAQALEAEVAAVLFGDEVAAAVGFPAGALPAADLVRVARHDVDRVAVPGLGRCRAITAHWDGGSPGHLLVARLGGESFSAQERDLLRGMARMVELTLTMLRAFQTEHELRERSERQAAENARLAESLQEQQRLLVHLSVIQRAISRREPLSDILETITVAAHELLDDEIVGLWVRDPDAPDRARLRSSVGLPAKRLPGVLLREAGAAGEAMRRDDVVVLDGYAQASPVIRELTGGRLRASMAVPVHENGEVCGSLLVASYRADRVYGERETETLRTFAQNVSLALTDAHTFHKMNQAVHDSLTGLAGRGLFLERLTGQLAADTTAALLFIDLDRFKAVNDSLGHAAGDRVLMAAAERITGQLRAVDLAGRLGGDEFAVLLRGVRHADEAGAVAERIGRALRQPLLAAGGTVAIDASIGIAMNPVDNTDPADLMRRADIAMYQAKRNGRGRFEVFAAPMLRQFAETE